ncbi:SusD/RagB family nutrient-binding outer membrane lipoprotein [Fulvivirga ligni]|uniref:SusD/RagB family nutrient-binding outer membrane lipoprotein n=1 Tax=Fulvivirga ligni TaxID=2904246 RepID=UPI001F3A3260|nr:SusD/RagB family nutrient-binding outer membrane lipoprotein [Fulvivirga ligni]UII22608.1 SusD/RagB family nutrient-binding outer membrane lipoprotein [Fulvivirga ligni]
MKYLKYILVIVLLSQSIVSCDTVDFGDTNQNVNGPSEPYPAGLLGGAIMGFSTLTGRSGITRPTLYVQYQSQVTYTTEMLYGQTPDSWYTYYIDILNPLNTVIEYVGNEENQNSLLLSQGSPENQIGVAMIFRSIVMKRVTDTWGDVPFSSALEGTGNLTPAYDSQESIYQAIIADLKAGRDMLDASATLPTGDIIYSGDVDMWKKLANSVLLQTTLQLSKVYPSNSGFAATEFNLALNDANGLIDEVSEEAWFKYEDASGFTNPWNGNRTPDYFLSEEFTDALHGEDDLNPTSNTTYDSRLEVYADDATLDGVAYGYDDGAGDGKASMSVDYFWNNVTPLPLMTASYTYLNRAEAANLGWTSESAEDMLTEGIEKSFESLQYLTEIANGLNGAEVKEIAADGSAYAAARIADAATADDGLAQIIGEEKWVSLFAQGFDAWSEWRRTGYPDLTPATDAVTSGGITRRYMYPSEEAGLNGVNYSAAINGLSPSEDDGKARVWWDQ